MVFAEKRDGGKGGLTVIHPQADVGFDLGRYVTLDAGYAADAVSGATATIYQVDAVSSATVVLRPTRSIEAAPPSWREM